MDMTQCNDSYIPTSTQYFIALGTYSTAIITTGGLITLGLFLLFFEQIAYTNQTAHHGVKRHIYWIASVFPMMTSMSLVALLIPRAHNICLSVKMVYMSMGISHFTGLTMVMFGGEEVLMERGRDDTFRLNVRPLCCCCRCLPRPPVTKYALRLVVLLTDQLPFAQAAYYIIISILLSADNVTLGDVAPTGAFLWLNLFKLASAMFGIYGFMILSNFSREYLDNFTYWKKSRSIRLLLLITNFQSMIFNIMTNYGVFPCLPPYVSPTVYKQTVDNSLYLLEMMLLGPYTFWQYHDKRFATPVTSSSHHRRSGRSRSSTTSGSIKNSTTDTISTTITATGEQYDSTDEELSTGGYYNNRRSCEDSIVVDIGSMPDKDDSVNNFNSRNSSIRGSRTSNSKQNRIKSVVIVGNDGISNKASGSSRRVRENGINRNNSMENSASNNRNSNREDRNISRENSERASKRKSDRSLHDTSQGVGENSGSVSRDRTRNDIGGIRNMNRGVSIDGSSHDTSGQELNLQEGSFNSDGLPTSNSEPKRKRISDRPRKLEEGHRTSNPVDWTYNVNYDDCNNVD